MVSSGASTTSPDLVDFWWSYLKTGKYQIRAKKAWNQVEKYLDLSKNDKILLENRLSPNFKPDTPLSITEITTKIPEEDIPSLKNFIFLNQGLFEIKEAEDKDTKKEGQKDVKKYIRDSITAFDAKQLLVRVKDYRALFNLLKNLPVPTLLLHLKEDCKSLISRLDLERAKIRVILPYESSLKKMQSNLDQASQVAEESEQLIQEISKWEESYKTPPFGAVSMIWFEIVRIMKLAYSLEIPKWLPSWSPFEMISKFFQDSPSLTINRLYENFEQAYSEEKLPLLQETSFYFSRSGILKAIPKTQEDSEGQYSRKIEKKLALYLNLLILPIITDIWQDDIDRGRLEDPQKFNIALTSISTFQTNSLEEQIEELVQSQNFEAALDGIQVKEKELLASYSSLSGILVKLREYFSPFEIVVEKFLEFIDTTVTSLKESTYQLQQHVKSVRDEIKLQGLREFVDDRIHVIETSLHQYEKDSAVVVSQNQPVISKVKEILNHFKRDFQGHNTEVADKFKEYMERNPDLDVFPVLKNWELIYERVKNRIKIVLSAMLTQLLEPFRPIIDEEKTFFKDAGDQESSLEDLPLNFSFELITPSKLTEKELRDRLQKLDQKLVELEKVAEVFTIQKTKYEAALSEVVREKEGIKASQCVVCHRQIDFARDDIIKCPHCGCISHRLCSLSYIEEHNNCPVCNNAYLIPDGRIYENGVEYFDENIDYQPQGNEESSNFSESSTDNDSPQISSQETEQTERGPTHGEEKGH